MYTNTWKALGIWEGRAIPVILEEASGKGLTEMKAQQARPGEGKAFSHADHLNTPLVASTQSQCGKLISSS